MSPVSDEELDARVKVALGEVPAASPAVRARVLSALGSAPANARRRPRYLARAVAVALAASVAAVAWMQLRHRRSAAPTHQKGELLWVDDDDDIEAAFAQLAEDDS